jgi:hypothetical protein
MSQLTHRHACVDIHGRSAIFSAAPTHLSASWNAKLLMIRTGSSRRTYVIVLYEVSRRHRRGPGRATTAGPGNKAPSTALSGVPR